MKIAYISTYTPRECGIATFNKNLMQAIGVNLKKDNLVETGFVIALNDSEDYPAKLPRRLSQSG
jgi:hypothetical protein